MFIRRSALTCSALALACVLAGCPQKSGAVLPTSPTSTGSTAPVATSAPLAPTVASGAVITGTLTVPAGIVASGAGNIVASGAGNSRVLMAVKTAAAADAKVYLADAAGNPIPNLPAVQTDANGKFTIPNVPAGFTFLVAAEARTKDGKTATFQTLTKSTELGATADITPSTALVTAAVVRDLKNGDLGSFNPSAFRTAAETTEKNLADDKLPDFSSRTDVLAKMDALVAAVGELKQSLDQVKQDLAEIKQSIADLQKAIEDQAKATPAPTNQVQPPPGPNNPPPTTPGNPPPTEQPRPVSSPVNTPGTTNPPTTGCSTPTDHVFHPQIPGVGTTTGWKFLVFDASGAQIAGNAVDGNGNVGVRVPAGCPLTLQLIDASGAQSRAPFQVDPARPDSATAPINVGFPGPTGGNASTGGGTTTSCTPAQVRVSVKSSGGRPIAKIVINGNSSAPVDTTGIASLTAPTKCPFDVVAYDGAGNQVGQLHLSIEDPNNPPPFQFP